MSKIDIKHFRNENADYDNIRRILQNIYLYGNSSVLDLAKSGKLNVGERAIRDYLRRFDNYFNTQHEGGVIKNHNLPGRKQDKRSARIHIDPYAVPYNILAETFREHTIVCADVIFYLYLLECLPNEDDTLSDTIRIKADPYRFLPETFPVPNGSFISAEDNEFGLYVGDILDAMKDTYAEHAKYLNRIAPNKKLSTKFPLSEDQVADRLKELVAIGILETEFNEDEKSASSQVTYRLTPNLFSEDNLGIDISESILNLHEMTQFFYSFHPFSIPGYFLSSKINLLLEHQLIDSPSSKGIKSDVLSSFTYENARYQTLMDDDILWTILCAIHNGRVLSFSYQTSTIDKQITMHLLPIKVIQDTFYGRCYVFGYKYKSQQNGELLTCRIDRIFDIKESTVYSYTDCRLFSNRKAFTQKEGEHIYSDAFSHVYNIDLGTKKPSHVEVTFSFTDSEEDALLLSYLKDSLRGGALKPGAGAGEYIYTNDITSLPEIVPWLNSFGDKAMPNKNTSPALYDLMKNATREALALYDSVS